MTTITIENQELTFAEFDKDAIREILFDAYEECDEWALYETEDDRWLATCNFENPDEDDLTPTFGLKNRVTGEEIKLTLEGIDKLIEMLDAM